MGGYTKRKGKKVGKVSGREGSWWGGVGTAGAIR
jgi:hypothetical protein